MEAIEHGVNNSENKKRFGWIKKLLITLFIIIELVIIGALVFLGIYLLKTKPLVDSGIFQLITTLDAAYYQDIDKQKMWEGALRGIADSLGDPYTTYMTVNEFESLNTMLTGEYSGVGLTISYDPDDKRVVVVSPMEGGPAQRAGIKTGDKIVAVDGVAVWGDKLDDAGQRMRGVEGSSVRLSVVKEGTSITDVIDIDVIRESIIMESVSSEMIGDVGYIRVTTFDQETDKAFIKSVLNLQQSGAKGIIVDLRGNSGGVLDVACNMADVFLPKDAVIVYTQDRNGNKKYYNARMDINDIPLAILVDEGSASASEIFAGALKDHGKAVLIGKKTFGKGLVQTVLPIIGNDSSSSATKTGSSLQEELINGYVKVTIAQYFTPSGSNIDKIGINPDIEVDLNSNVPFYDLEKQNDPQLIRALEYIRSI